jgi:hypothetical protein
MRPINTQKKICTPRKTDRSHHVPEPVDISYQVLELRVWQPKKNCSLEVGTHQNYWYSESTSSTSSSASTMLVQLQHCLGAAFRFLSEHPAKQAGTPLLLLPRISRHVFLPWPGEHWVDNDLYQVLVFSGSNILHLCWALFRFRARRVLFFLELRLF